MEIKREIINIGQVKNECADIVNNHILESELRLMGKIKPNTNKDKDKNLINDIENGIARYNQLDMDIKTIKKHNAITKKSESKPFKIKKAISKRLMVIDANGDNQIPDKPNVVMELIGKTLNPDKHGFKIVYSQINHNGNDAFIIESIKNGLRMRYALKRGNNYCDFYYQSPEYDVWAEYVKSLESKNLKKYNRLKKPITDYVKPMKMPKNLLVNKVTDFISKIDMAKNMEIRHIALLNRLDNPTLGLIFGDRSFNHAMAINQINAKNCILDIEDLMHYLDSLPKYEFKKPGRKNLKKNLINQEIRQCTMVNPMYSKKDMRNRNHK